MKNEVWVTGIGVVSAAGNGFDSYSQALRSNKSYAQRLPDALFAPRVAAADVKALDSFSDDRKAWLAIQAVEDAWQMAASPACAGKDVAVFLGTGLSSITPFELQEDLYPHLTDGGFDRAAMSQDLSSGRAAPWRHLPDRVSNFIADKWGASGPSSTSFSACSAAAQAILEGVRCIQRGHAQVAIVGGHDSMNHPMGLLSFVVLGALSQTLCRPFDRDRDGFLLGEGAGVLIIENAEHAKSRNIRPLAKILGGGTSLDAWNPTAPHPDGRGAERAMKMALQDAGLQPQDIDYINAHGTGTPVGDLAESKAIARLFPSNTPVSSIKGAIGHTIAAAGALEAIACIAALQGSFVPATVGLENQDPRCAIRVMKNVHEMDLRRAISNSFGFGGQNCSLIFARAD